VGDGGNFSRCNRVGCFLVCFLAFHLMFALNFVVYVVFVFLVETVLFLAHEFACRIRLGFLELVAENLL